MYLEGFCGGVYASEYLVDSHLVAVGDKDLPKGFACHKGEQVLHAGHIKLIEEVVQKEYGQLAAYLLNYLKLCKFKRYEEALLLALRAHLLYREALYEKEHVISVRAIGGVAKAEVLLQRAQENLLWCAAVKV